MNCQRRCFGIAGPLAQAVGIGYGRVKNFEFWDMLCQLIRRCQPDMRVFRRQFCHRHSAGCELFDIVRVKLASRNRCGLLANKHPKANVKIL